MHGYHLDDDRLEATSWLACPVKANPPNWQHGRVIYAVLRSYCVMKQPRHVVCVDVGTAKGFSAICAAFALYDSRTPGHVYSTDVIDPLEKTYRNSVWDCDGPTDVRWLLNCNWPEVALKISLEKGTGVSLLKSMRGCINFAFLDGKHTYEAVNEELNLLAAKQEKGDICIADDLQIAGVERAVTERADYSLRVVNLLRHRRHAIMTRK